MLNFTLFVNLTNKYITFANMYSIKEFAEKHGITRSGVEAAMRDGRLKWKRINGRRLLYTNSDYKPILGKGRKPTTKK